MNANLVHGLPEDQHDYGMAKGHSPVAEKVACIDFDGTIVPWGPLMGEKRALPGARETVLTWKKAGYSIVIFTSRLSRKWAESVVGTKQRAIVNRFLDQQHEYVAETLSANDIPFDDITAEKVPAEFYVDDKAVAFRGDWLAASIDPLCYVAEDEE